ncbi:MAG: putative glycolipid-binding domain-containing protein [Pseudonocardia sp.]
MLTWQSGDGIGLEGVRLQYAAGGLRALGRLVRADFTASYRLIVGENGVVQRISLTSAVATRERHLTLNRSEEGLWLSDSGSAGGQPAFGGALDVDVAYSALFNALPIRRLGLHREAGDETVPMVFVSLPELEPQLVEQRYRTVSTLDDAGRAVIGFSWGAFAADLVVDGDGLVRDHPGVATLVADPVAAPAA